MDRDALHSWLTFYRDLGIKDLYLDADMRQAMAVYLGKEVVSRVRSGGYGYTLKRNIVYAYLPMALAKTGTRVVVDVFDAVHPAEVAPSVLLDPKGEKLRT